MGKNENPVLGMVDCGGCGGSATVHQTRRGKGRYLYTRCMECGVDQRTGAAIQTRLWRFTQWRSGAVPICPPNVVEKEGISVVEPNEQPKQPSKQAGLAVVDTTEPTTETGEYLSVDEPDPQPARQPKQPSKTALYALLAIVAGMALVPNRTL